MGSNSTYNLYKIAFFNKRRENDNAISRESNKKRRFSLFNFNPLLPGQNYLDLDDKIYRHYLIQLLRSITTLNCNTFCYVKGSSKYFVLLRDNVLLQHIILYNVYIHFCHLSLALYSRSYHCIGLIYTFLYKRAYQPVHSTKCCVI